MSNFYVQVGNRLEFISNISARRIVTHFTMKPRHQIKFGQRFPERSKKPRSKVSATISNSVSPDIVRAGVKVGERELQFARALSDTEKVVRDVSLSSLREWLSENASKMSMTEMDELWKGLFYCLWMADKRPIITSTIRNVVDLTDIAGWPFLEALFTCLMREWFGIDKHRVDKFYELISRALSKGIAMFSNASSYESFTEVLDHFVEMLTARVWLPSRTSGVGVALHILDVYVDQVVNPILEQAKRIGCEENQIVTIFNVISEDLYTMLGLGRGWQLSINNRIAERFLNRIIAIVSNGKLELSLASLCTAVDHAAKQIFVVASDKKTSYSERKRLYNRYLRLKAFVEKRQSRMKDKRSDDSVQNHTKTETSQEMVQTCNLGTKDGNKSVSVVVSKEIPSDKPADDHAGSVDDREEEAAQVTMSEDSPTVKPVDAQPGNIEDKEGNVVQMIMSKETTTGKLVEDQPGGYGMRIRDVELDMSKKATRESKAVQPLSGTPKENTTTKKRPVGGSNGLNRCRKRVRMAKKSKKQ